MRGYSSATTRFPIPFRCRDLPPERSDGLVGICRRLARLCQALVDVWRAGIYVNELLLARPGEHEGPLRWQRDGGRLKLVGRALGSEDLRAGGEPGAGDDRVPLLP